MNRKFRPRVRALKLAREVRERLTKELGQPVKVIMYGSQARGDAKKDADIDLLVIIPSLNNPIRKKISNATWEVGFEAGRVICAVPTTPRDFEYYKILPFYQTIRKEGVPA